MWRKGNPPTLWECKLAQPLWRTVQRVLKKLKREIPYDPEIHLLGIYPEKNVPKDTGTPTFIAALFTIAKIWKHLNVQQMNRQSRCSILIQWNITQT